MSDIKQHVMGPGSPTQQFIREMKRMSEENWSLKGKAKWQTWDGDVISAYDWVKKEDYLYEYEDIETLRQKLIEDFIGQFSKNQIEVECIINKRFGVEK